VTALASASDRIRELIAGRAGARGTEEVTLAGPDASASPASGREPASSSPAPSADRGSVPLCDWRALVCPPNADEWLELRQGRPDDAAEIGRVCREPERGVHPALRGSALMVLPATGWHRTRMRAVQAEFSDPVSFALAEGRPAARFPRLRGWSAQDVAARAVAEHRARLRWGQAGALGERGLLLTAARSGLFHRSLAESDPVLCPTGAEAARRLGADPERIRDLRGAVASLPAFHDLDLGG